MPHKGWHPRAPTCPIPALAAAAIVCMEQTPVLHFLQWGAPQGAAVPASAGLARITPIRWFPAAWK